MKKLMMICALLFSVVTFANAQQGGGPLRGGMMMKPEDRVKQLDEKLKLSDDQKTKLTAIYVEQAETMKKMREEAKDGDRDAMREKGQKLRAESELKITALLTEDQKKTYKTWQDEQRAEMEKRMKERQGGGNN
ncbi:Spy/CpxP family protein refolding chaperone [Pedobacter sp. BMA]|uniref:Spy/CpxP family protein refolding chaperone n=1 Tax=Pedobacter sp. BMA TaxID=1663685 RepID=UPI00064B0B1E|nr:Spy/CpxP family protein refolding chaperone [Pedobacter sp. BMA]KLT67490.1 hypothetical protein AB669_02010 [Pedobacter sp. BMA]